MVATPPTICVCTLITYGELVDMLAKESFNKGDLAQYVADIGEVNTLNRLAIQTVEAEDSYNLVAAELAIDTQLAAQLQSIIGVSNQVAAIITFGIPALRAYTDTKVAALQSLTTALIVPLQENLGQIPTVIDLGRIQDRQFVVQQVYDPLKAGLDQLAADPRLAAVPALLPLLQRVPPDLPQQLQTEEQCCEDNTNWRKNTGDPMARLVACAAPWLEFMCINNPAVLAAIVTAFMAGGQSGFESIVEHGIADNVSGLADVLGTFLGV